MSDLRSKLEKKYGVYDMFSDAKSMTLGQCRRDLLIAVEALEFIKELLREECDVQIATDVLDQLEKSLIPPIKPIIVKL